MPTFTLQMFVAFAFGFMLGAAFVVFAVLAYKHAKQRETADKLRRDARIKRYDVK